MVNANKYTTELKRQHFSGLIVLMILSLVGIIMVQVFWIKQAMSVRDEQFAQHVNWALSRASYRIERNQNLLYINHMARHAVSHPHNREESLIMTLNDFADNSQPIELTINDKKMHVTHHKNGLNTVTMQFDTVINNGNYSQNIKTYTSVTRGVDDEIDDNRVDIEKLMNQMAYEMEMGQNPANYLELSVVKSALAYELRNVGLDAPFEFAVTSDGKPMQNLSSKGFRNSYLKHAYRTNLFPNEIFAHSNQLVVFFPNRLQSILRKILLPIAASVLFALIILITFGVTLRMMINQKRTTEVKTDFMNNMTHEFKTPLATIQLAADSISSPGVITEPEKIQRFIQIIKEENRRMNRQVESVLQMSLLDKKDFNLNLQPAHIEPIVAKAVNNFGLQIEKRNGTITFTNMAENDCSRIDVNHFANVIYNLIDNANKYTIDTEPHIEVLMRNVGKHLFIEVKDNGIGMDRETQEKIFEKFYRHPTGDVHTVKGFGLGLSYAKIIVMSCKGEIRVSSQKGEGSTFEICLPTIESYEVEN